jgi:hypothetical protein
VREDDPGAVAPLTDDPAHIGDILLVSALFEGDPESLETANESQRRQLEEAGWEPVDDGNGPVVWRNPSSGRLYPQEVAVDLIRSDRLQAPNQDDPDAVS